MTGTMENSVLCRWLLLVWQSLRAAWDSGTVGGALRRLGAALGKAVEGSRLWDVLTRRGALRRGWTDSRLQRLISGLFNLPVAAAKWLYRKGEALWSSSGLFRGVTALGRRAWLLLGLFALVMLVAPHEVWDNLYAFLGSAVVFFLYALSCADRDKRLEVGRMGPWFAFYFIFITLGLVLSLSVSLSLRFYLFHLTGFFVVLTAVSAVEDYRQLRTMLVCGAVGVAIAAVYGCYQGYVGVEVVASQQDLMLNKGMPGRIYSFFDNPNNFAEVLVMLVPLTGALTLNAKTWRGKLWGLVGLGLGVAALGMTLSRSSWLGMVLAVVVFLALMNWRFIPALVILGLCAIPFLPDYIWNRILTIGNMKDSSARYRIAIWEDTARLLRDHGVMGTGLGNDVMGNVFRDYPTLYDGHYPIHTHNNFLQMWGEVGILGFLAYLGLMLGQVKEGIQSFARADKALKRILAAALGAFIGILAIGLVEYTWFYPRNMFLFWYLFGVIAACVKLAGKEKAQ